MIGEPRPEELWRVYVPEKIVGCTDIPAHEAGHYIVSLALMFPTHGAVVTPDRGYMAHLPGAIELWEDYHDKNRDEIPRKETTTESRVTLLNRDAESEWPVERLSLACLDMISIYAGGLQGEQIAKNDPRVTVYRNDTDHKQSLAIARRYLGAHRIPAYCLKLARWLLEQNIEAHNFVTERLRQEGRIGPEIIDEILGILRVRGKSRFLPEFINKM